jgi:hypothetical protein
MDDGIETFSLESGYRFHPIDKFHPLFLQASFGIIRLNPVLEGTSPRYTYKAFDRLTVGAVIRLGETSLAVLPKISLRTLWMEGPPSGEMLQGYNQFEFGLNAGILF